MKKKKILYIAPRYPYPLIGGDRVKTYYLLKYLAERYELTFICLNQLKNLSESDLKHVENLGIKTYIFDLNPLSAALACMPKLLSGKPLEILYYYSSEMQAKIDELIEKENFDLVISFFLRSAEYVKDKNIKKLLIAEDCRTEYQYRSYLKSTNVAQKMVRKWEYEQLKKYETKTMSHFDKITFVTDVDISIIKTMKPSLNIGLLSNGTEVEKFKPAENIKKEGIIFTGKLDVWSNTMMAEKIAKEIFPEIKKRVPNAKLIIAGGYPPSSIAALASDSIKIYANVESLIPYLQSAQLFVHPHEAATGIQNKVLEAMACGCPVITTQTGIQGINVKHGESVLLAKNNEEFINYAVDLLQNQELADKISINARKAILENNSWEAIYSQFDYILDEILD